MKRIIDHLISFFLWLAIILVMLLTVALVIAGVAAVILLLPLIIIIALVMKIVKLVRPCQHPPSRNERSFAPSVGRKSGRRLKGKVTTQIQGAKRKGQG